MKGNSQWQSKNLRIHALSDMEVEAGKYYRQIVEIDSEIMALRWMMLDRIEANQLAKQGAAAVAEAMKIWGIE